MTTSIPKAGTRIRQQAAAIFFLTKKRRTAAEIAHLLGSENKGSIDHVKCWLDVWADEGLARQVGMRKNQRGSPSPEWEWCANEPSTAAEAQEMPIPCDIHAGGVLYKKGTPLHNLVERIDVLDETCLTLSKGHK